MGAVEEVARWKAWWEQERQRLSDDDPEFHLYWVAPPGEGKDRLEASLRSRFGWFFSLGDAINGYRHLA